MISVKPDSEFSVDVSVNAGNYDFLELKAVVNIPMGEIFSARFSVSDRSRDGWVKNVWDPGHVPDHVNLVIEDIGPVFGIPLCDFPGATTPTGCVLWAAGPDEEPNTKRKLNNVDTRSYRAQLRIQPDDKWNINIAVDGLKSDRRALYGKQLTDSFGSTIDRFAPNFGEISYSKDSAETRDIFGASLNIDYAFGNGYSLRSITAYRDTKFNIVNDTDASALGFFYIDYTDGYKQKTQEFQIISPDDTNFKYVTGLYYYDQDLTTIREGIVGNAGWLSELPPGWGASNDGEVNTDVYAKYSTGFKSGGFNLDFVSQNALDAGLAFDEETADSYELGWKGTYLDGRLSINAAAFITNYQDYQVFQFFDLGFDEETGTQLISIRITNASEVDTHGLEIEATFNATAKLTFRGSLDVLHTGEYFTTIENEKVRNLTSTHPATFIFDLPSFGIPHTVDYGRVNAITTLNGRIGLIDGNGAWEVYLWGRNLTDEGEYLQYFPGFFGSLFATPMTPRTYGVQATFHF
jgi:outer membrane receptor protein involved in Fe transport